MFAAQVLALSVVFPHRLAAYVRLKASECPPELLARLYPGANPSAETDKLLGRFSLAHGCISAGGAALLGWMASTEPQLPGTTLMLVPVVFFVVQMLPMLVMAAVGLRQIVWLRAATVERKRKASLQPRRLRDLISPRRLAVELGLFLLFTALMLVLMHGVPQPIPLLLGYPMIGAAALGCGLQYAYLHWRLRGRKTPLETQDERLRTTATEAHKSLYGTLVSVVFLTLFVLLPRLDLQAWLPLAMSSFMVVVALQLCLNLPLRPQAGSGPGLGSRPAPHV